MVKPLEEENFERRNGGGRWIRTIEGKRRQIYSLLPLATRAPTLSYLLNCQNRIHFTVYCSEWRNLLSFVLSSKIDYQSIFSETTTVLLGHLPLFNFHHHLAKPAE